MNYQFLDVASVSRTLNADFKLPVNKSIGHQSSRLQAFGRRKQPEGLDSEKAMDLSDTVVRYRKSSV
jgi:hypothetical protein